MSEKDPIKAKLNHLCNYWRELKLHSRVSLSEYLDNGMMRSFAERKIHLAMECCLDMADYIIAEEHYRVPSSNRDAFAVLLENKIISNGLARRMGQLTSMRNILVHGYAVIDDRKVFEVLKHHLSDFEEFGKAMKKFLK
jgi:uncharacterized protein YutE (UPF0331/DUF86 family)